MTDPGGRSRFAREAFPTLLSSRYGNGAFRIKDLLAPQGKFRAMSTPD
jgi:hypothetical protein